MEDVIFMKKRTVIVSAVSTAIIVIAGITSFSLNKPDVKMAPIEKNTQVISKQGQIKSNGQSNKSESSSTQKDSEKSDNSKNTSGTSSKTENSSTSKTETSGSTATDTKSGDMSSNATVKNSSSTRINAKSSSDVEKESKAAGTFVDGNKDASVQQELQKRQEEAKKATVQSETKTNEGSVEIYANGNKI